MKTLYFDFYDESRQRQVPVSVYLPEKEGNNLPTIVFGPGYQGQEDIQKEELVYKKYTYLAEYFTAKGYAFVSIQHDVFGDVDGLEKVDPNAIQDEARRHLYIRGEANILFALAQLEKQNLPLHLDNLILSGHSNGGDIAKYFANQHSDLVHCMILFDARRARLKPISPLSVLMFEADDTTTDAGVIAEPFQENNAMRANLDLTVIKPRGALHASYIDGEVTESLKKKIFSALDWFLGSVT
ncbi:MAG: alpha/beta hydrolase [Gammaproteobacteria bacterium]|nr:alpha/beta hydrolase [Gammaproteobacteria bacterium]